MRPVEAILGRDDELARIAAFLEGETGILVLEGEPGIGKTTLWRSCLDAARSRGYRVLACAATSAETQLSFSGLRDLLEDVFDEVADELPPPQRRALEVTLLRREPGTEPPEQGAIAAAFLSALRLLATRSPVLLALDDAQWLDPASTVPVSYALRRLETEPIAAVIALRPNGSDGLALDAVDRVRLRDLSTGALGRILHERTGTAFPRSTVQRLHEASAGNPFHALELGRALLASPEDASRPLRPGAVLPVPDDLRALVKRRLLALPAETVDALTFASALARPTLETLGRALDRAAATPLRPAVEAGIADVDGDDVGFAHPLYSSAVYELAGAGRRAEVHRRLAEVIDDPEERSRHLALGTREPDAGVARALEESARGALARGAPAAAARLAAESVRLTPTGAEEDRLRRAVVEVDAHFAAGDAAHALALLERLVSTAPAGPLRAHLLSRQARVRHFAKDIDGSIALLRRALAEAGDETALRGEIEEGLAWGLLLARRDLDEAAAHAHSAAVVAEKRGDDVALAEGLAIEALLELVRGRPWEATMQRALALEPATLEVRVLRQPSFAYGYCLSCADELEHARDVFLGLARRAGEAGDDGSMPSILNHLALVECLAGRWERGLEHVGEGYARALESGQEPTQTSILGKRALVEARRGSLEEARATASQALALTGFDATEPRDALARGAETAIWAMGLVELSAGDPAGAVEILAPMAEVLLEAGVAEPGEVRCLPNLIEALAALERLDEAESLLAIHERWAEALQRPSTLMATGRCRGIVLAARGDASAALDALEGAAVRSEQVPMPFERAHALLALGVERRRARQRRAAREALEAARGLFDELGSAFWRDRVSSELARIGGRAPANSGELTGTERRIAELVAQGRTNREVAAELVLSVHTVEAALTSVYRKLDVRSRTEMARRLNV